MKVLAAIGREDVAMVYLAEMGAGKLVEFVESVQPPLPREKKWVLIVSTLLGCPVRCLMCDAGSSYHGRLSKEDILAQIDFLVYKRFPTGHIPVDKFKIQFARMGEPSLNPSVLEVLQEIGGRYRASGLVPSVSTVAPAGTDGFFERLLEIKKRQYGRGQFQLQFSIHTTDETWRDKLIPVKKWDFARVAAYGERFYEAGDKKITLNFALAEETPVDARVLLRYFDPSKFLIKITPINPTYQAVKNRLSSYIEPDREGKDYPVVRELRACGYQVLVSIGETEENRIGSNCGQYVMRHLKADKPIDGGYTYVSRVPAIAQIARNE